MQHAFTCDLISCRPGPVGELSIMLSSRVMSFFVALSSTCRMSKSSFSSVCPGYFTAVLLPSHWPQLALLLFSNMQTISPVPMLGTFLECLRA